MVSSDTWLPKQATENRPTTSQDDALMAATIAPRGAARSGWPDEREDPERSTGDVIVRVIRRSARSHSRSRPTRCVPHAIAARRSGAPVRRTGARGAIRWIPRALDVRSRRHIDCTTRAHEACSPQAIAEAADDSRDRIARSGARRRRLDPSAADVELSAAVTVAVGCEAHQTDRRSTRRPHFVVLSGLLESRRARIPLRSGQAAAQ